MSKTLVEFINTCSCCDEHVQTIKNAAKKHGDQVEVKVYYAGKDLEYLKKYGMVTKGTMIIDGKKKLDNLSKATIEKAIEDAVRS
jgi:archaellum component FlaF (FlaF/FlaG flagellin family)